MTLLSRGLGPRLMLNMARPRTNYARQASLQPRFFSQQSSQQFSRASLRQAKVPLPSRARASPTPPSTTTKTATAAATTATTATTAPRTPTIPTPTGRATTSYAESLATKGSPTTLYEAPSHFWFTLSSLSAGSFCILYAAINAYTNIAHSPPGLSWWVSPAFGGICMFMSGMGTYFLLGSSGVVRSIRALSSPAARAARAALSSSSSPSTISGSSAATAAAAATAARSSAPALRVEVEVRRLVPFAPPKRIVVEPQDIALPYRLASREVQQMRTGAQRAAEREQARRARDYDMSHLMTAPFRHAFRALGVVKDGMVRGVTREGFARIWVKGVRYKWDLTTGYLLDHGKPLDRLAKIRSGPPS